MVSGHAAKAIQNMAGQHYSHYSSFHHSVSKQDISTCAGIQHSMGMDVKMNSQMLSDIVLNAVLMTSGPDQTLSQHAFSCTLQLFYSPFLSQKERPSCGTPPPPYFHLLIRWHCISQKWLDYEFSLTLLSLCLHIRVDLASPTDLKWMLSSHKC